MSRIVLLTLACSAALAAAQYSTPDVATIEPWIANPCMLMKCSAGHVCEVKNGRGACVKQPEVQPYPVTLNACAATSCLVGSICVEENGVGRCVAPENNNCTVKFEEWKQCASCEATCENKVPFCNKMCQPPRCQCQQGFFRNKAGKCVTENDCDTAAVTPYKPSLCTRKNEEYKDCASACEPSCKTKDVQIMCIDMCKPGACQCKTGFYRADNGECVTKRQCPRIRDPPVTTPSDPQCKKNEGFASCSSMCEPKCGQYEPMACILMCGPPKCQCTSGFFRHSNGECMTRKECDQTPATNTCKKNQVFTECSTMCPPKCGEYGVRACMAMCGPAKCECASGFYLDNHGECVTRQECDAQSATPKTPSQADCKPNEKFTECSTQCEEKCGEALTRACPASCGPPMCQCELGFLRNSVGDCVSKSDCELDTPITCANIDCRSGMICEMKNGQPNCVNKEKLTCNTVKCAGGNRCLIDDEGKPSCVPMMTCANVRCAGPCTDTPTGPQCGPRPLILPISVGPSSTPNPEKLTCNTVKCAGGHRCLIDPEGKPSCVPSITCANVRCAGPCTDTPDGPQCGPRPQILPISVGPSSTPGCPPNEEIRACTNKCNEPFCGDENFARRCAQVCLTPECQCIEGFVRDRGNGCVKREDCPKKEEEGCGANEERKICGNKCMEPFCGDELVDINCSIAAVCQPSACECRKGFVRDPKSKRCLRREQCPSRACGINEERKICGNRCMEPFCGDELAGIDLNCLVTNVCQSPACECKQGFVRDRAGRETCIRRDQCRSEISPCDRKNCGIAMRCIDQNGQAKCVPLFQNNQKSVAASPPTSAASPTLSTFHKFPSLPDSCDQVKCIDGGVCVMEEVKCVSGPCKPVPKCRGGSTTVAADVPSVDPDVPATGYGSVYQPFADNCDQLECKQGEECTMERIPCFAPPCKKGAVCRPANTICRKEHEVWDQCYHGCGETCQHRDQFCTEQCGPGGCICDTFYIRDEVSGNCVRLEDCPSNQAIPIEKPRILEINEQASYDSPLPADLNDVPIGPVPPPPTCENFQCPAGQICTLPPMACSVPPCTRRPTCVNEQDVVPSCDDHQCPVGQRCQLKKVFCYKAPCYPVPMCEKDPNYLPGDEIVPTCDGHQCPAGQKCQLQEVQCIRAPCYPIPDCVIDMVPPSCTLPCPYGMSCVLETVLCKKAPCPQKPSCRLLQVDPVPNTCAAVTCQFGETCVLEPLPCLVAPCPERAICRPNDQSCKRKNEIYSQCFTGCEATCQTRNKACTMQCGPGGCQCNSGYIRNEVTGECVLERDCPRGPTCAVVLCRRDTRCEMRNGAPVCVRRPASDHPIPMGTMPPTVTCATLGCQQGEKCVQKSYGPQCEPVTCPANEQYDRCFHGCEATCDEPNPFCTKQCGPGGCRCTDGFVRDPSTKRCVQQASCPGVIY